jgi:hypothetical protein
MRFLFISLITVFFHVYHVSTFELERNEKTKTFQMSLHVFTDDLKETIGFKEEPSHQELEAFFKDKFKLVVNSKEVSFNYIGYETEEEHDYYLFFESEKTPKVKELSFYTRLFTNDFEDQKNRFLLKINNKNYTAILDHNKNTATFKLN